MGKYLIVKCTELSDQWECSVDREPLCIVDNYDDYLNYGYEVYKIEENGKIGNRIKNYNVCLTQPELVVYTFIEGAEEDYNGLSDVNIVESIKLENDNKDIIANSQIFEEFAKKYLRISLDTAKHWFVRQSCVSDADDIHKNYDSEYCIAIKRGNKVERNY